MTYERSAQLWGVCVLRFSEMSKLYGDFAAYFERNFEGNFEPFRTNFATLGKMRLVVGCVARRYSRFESFAMTLRQTPCKHISTLAESYHQSGPQAMPCHEASWARFLEPFLTRAPKKPARKRAGKRRKSKFIVARQQ